MGGYARFSPGDEAFEIYHRDWTGGVFSLVVMGAISSFTYFTGGWGKWAWGLYAIAGVIGAVGAWKIGFFRHAHFKKNGRTVTYTRGWWRPLIRRKRLFQDIAHVELKTFRRKGKQGYTYHSALGVVCGGRRWRLAVDGPGANPNAALRLARLIGCGVKLRGANRLWRLTDEDLHLKTPQEIAARLPPAGEEAQPIVRPAPPREAPAGTARSDRERWIMEHGSGVCMEQFPNAPDDVTWKILDIRHQGDFSMVETEPSEEQGYPKFRLVLWFAPQKLPRVAAVYAPAGVGWQLLSSSTGVSKEWQSLRW